MDDSMDGIGRVESGTETEQLPKISIQNINTFYYKEKKREKGYGPLIINQSSLTPLILYYS